MSVDLELTTVIFVLTMVDENVEGFCALMLAKNQAIVGNTDKK